MQWETDLKTAQQKAAASNRLIVIHFWAPWCPPCMRMEHEVFNQPGLNEALGAAFVPLKLNYDDHGDIAKQYGVSKLPTDIVVTAQGELVKKLKSPQTAAQYIHRLNQVAEDSRANVPGIAAAPSSQPVSAPLAAAAGGGATATATSGNNGGRYADYFREQAVEPSAVGPRYASQATTAWDQAGQPAATGAATQPRGNGVGGPGNWAVTTNATQQPATPPTDFHDRRTAAVGTNAAAPIMKPDLQNANASPGSPFAQASATTSASNVAASGAAAFQPAPPAARPQATEASMGLDGYCPVHLAEKQQWVPGNRQWGVIHRGRTYLFASPACKERFLTEPDRFSPIMSGNDPVVAVDQGQMAPGRREHGVFFSGQIVLFSSESSLERFYQNPDRYAAAMTTQR